MKTLLFVAFGIYRIILEFFTYLLFSKIILTICEIAFELIELINSMLILWISEFIA